MSRRRAQVSADGADKVLNNRFSIAGVQLSFRDPVRVSIRTQLKKANPSKDGDAKLPVYRAESMAPGQRGHQVSGRVGWRFIHRISGRFHPAYPGTSAEPFRVPDGPRRSETTK